MVMQAFNKFLVGMFGSRNERIVKSYMQIALAAGALEEQIKALSDDQLKTKTAAFKEALKSGTSAEQILPEAFAVVREAARRNLDMRHYDVQLVGGHVLFEGKIAEMATGEGKTLVATLAAYLVHLTGRKVHLITVNDYLAKRDADWMSRPLVYFPISLACWLTFLVLHRTNTPPSGDPANAVTVYYLYLILTIIGVAVALLRSASLPDRPSRTAYWWAYVIPAAVIAVVIFTTNASVVQADIHFKRGQAYQDTAELDKSIDLYKRALSLKPREDHYYLFLGQAYLRKAQTGTDQGVDWYREALGALERARDISPLDPDHHVNLGTFYHYWAEAVSEPSAVAEKLEKAESFYRQAMAMSPVSHGDFKDDAFRAALALAGAYVDMGNTDKAIQQLNAAKDLASAEERAGLDNLIAQLEAQGE